MIRIELAKEPPDFNEKVRLPGREYLCSHPKGELRPYWTACKNALYEAYQGYCSYTTFRIPSRLDAVVDHFLPKSTHPDSAYEWDNYRLSSFHVNSVKNDSEEIIDPMLIPENGFLLEEDMKIKANPAAFDTFESLHLAEKTIERLKLNSAELIHDRNALIEEMLSCVNECGDAAESLTIVARMLCKQSRFLYREAVRLNYLPPLAE